MGRAGSALDNAVIESWHSTVEIELRQLERFPTTAHARTRVAGWIEEYNHDRRHSSLGMLSPVAYELHLMHQPGHNPQAAAGARLNSRLSMMAPSSLTSRPRLRVASGQP